MNREFFGRIKEILKNVVYRFLGFKITEIHLRKNVYIIKKDRIGNVIYSKKISNVITNVGKAEVAGLINEVTSGGFKYIAIGTGTTSPSASDTALENEVARKLGTTSRKTVNVTNDTAVVEATFSSSDGLSGSQTISESGLFDDSAGGNILSRDSLSDTMNWDNGEQLTIRYEITVS